MHNDCTCIEGMLPNEFAVDREMQGKYTYFLGILLLTVSSIQVLENVKCEISVAFLSYGSTHVGNRHFVNSRL
jgi:hypothetical protein